jgi:hypothetical protein
MKKMERQKRDPEAKMKTLEEKVQTLRQVLTELKTEAEESIKDYESTNPFAVKVSGKIEGFKTAIDMVA